MKKILKFLTWLEQYRLKLMERAGRGY